MKKLRKLLTTEEKDRICMKTFKCEDCPLSMNLVGNFNSCYTMVEHMEELIKTYWNTEIEVDKRVERMTLIV